jgi:hypothetical protein
MQEQERVPLFRDLEGALSFAYTWRARLCVKTASYGEYTAPDGSVLILSMHEKKAQAEHIHDVIASHLSADQRALLDATHGGDDRHDAIERLVCRFEDANRNRTMLRMVLMREFIFGETYCPSQGRIARECGVNQATVSRIAARITQEIAALRQATHEKLRPALERRGLIPREEIAKTC